jgi:Spy/CpxP family protein refolding chaperone
MAWGNQKPQGESGMTIERLIKTAGAVVVIGLMFAAMPTLAQEGGSGEGGGHHRGRMMSPEQRTEHLTKALNLSDDQKGKVLSILQDQQKQMEGVRSDSSLSQDERWSKMREIHQNASAQIKGNLNPDQAKKFDEMQQRMAEHREQKGNNDKDNAPPPQ